MLVAGTPRIEECKFGMKQCREYCIKAGRPLFEIGNVLSSEEQVRRTQLAQQQASNNKAHEHRVDSLKIGFDIYKSVTEWKQKDPATYARNCHGIDLVYANRLREVPIIKPKIDWFFGPTRSGKTYAAL